MEKSSSRAATNSLDQLRKFTIIVADTGDFGSLKEYAPQDATTNPSLIYKAAQIPDYQPLIDKAIADQPAGGLSKAALAEKIVDVLLVLFGVEILKIVPGRVSTETDARLSFDKGGLIANARHFISLYEQQGIPRERILIKIASTWEGIQAATVLETEGIHCNMTLLFSLPQAVACAHAKATLISPFVGRILDWHKAKAGHDFPPAEDPGVESVRTIFAYYKHFGISTEVMGASFRNTGEILELAGCDALTISPHLLEELRRSNTPVECKLSTQLAASDSKEPMLLDERQFRWRLNEDAMATEKLAEGIRLFHTDAQKLAKLIEERL